MSFNRREFLETTLGGLAAVGAGGMLGLDRLIGGDSTAYAGFPKPDASAGFRPDTLFLTWQRDPTTTMTIQWLGHEHKQSAQISYAVLGKDEWQTAAAPKQKPFPTTQFEVFRTELTGLSPGTEYQFKIGDKSPTFRFRTMPAKATNDFTFVSGGDAGVNQHTIDNNIVAAKQDPMFCLMGGDIAYDNGVSAATNIQYHRDYSRTMIDTQGRLIPMVVCIGNHEVRTSKAPLHDKAPFYFAWHDGLFADNSFNTLDFGDYLSLVLLDTNHAMPAGGEQTSWLEKTLADRVDIPNLIAVNHVPAYPSVRDFKFGGGAPNRKFWVPLFEKYNVDLVLEHHDHAFKRTFPMKDGLKDPNGILYLGDGSWGKIRKLNGPEKTPYLEHANESYHFSIHRLEGAERFHMAMNDSGRIIDVCTTKKKPRGKSMG